MHVDFAIHAAKSERNPTPGWKTDKYLQKEIDQASFLPSFSSLFFSFLLFISCSFFRVHEAFYVAGLPA